MGSSWSLVYNYSTALPSDSIAWADVLPPPACRAAGLDLAKGVIKPAKSQGLALEAFDRVLDHYLSEDRESIKVMGKSTSTLLECCSPAENLGVGLTDSEIQYLRSQRGQKAKPTPYTMNPTPCTPNPQPQSLNPKPSTPNSTP